MSADQLPPKGVYPTPDEIAQRAYEMLLDRLSAPYGIVDYWRLAEAELLDRAASRATRPTVARQRRRRRD
jgi:hypothetical protein